MKSKKYNTIILILLVVLLLLLILGGVIIINNNRNTTIYTKNSDSAIQNNENDYIKIYTWEDLYRLEEKDVDKKVYCIAIVNNINYEEFYKEGDYYSTSIELKLYDKDFQEHYFTVGYKRPYNAEKILEKDIIAFTGIFKNGKHGKKIEITEVKEIHK